MSDAAQHRLGHHPPAQFPLVVKGLAAISRLLAVVEGLLIGAFLLALIGLATFECVARNLNHQAWIPEWADGVIRHAVFIVGFLGAAYATFTGRHIRIDAVTRLAPPKRRMWLRIVTTLVALGVVGVLIKTSYEFLQVCRESVDATQATQFFTDARGALIMIAGFALIAFHFAVQLAMDVVYVVTGIEPPQSWIAEASHGGEATVAEVEEVAQVPAGVAPDPAEGAAKKEGEA